MKNIESLSLKDKKVLVRVDFNVPLDENQKVTDITRIKATKPTVAKILKEGGAAILMSHMGRPKGQAQEIFSLKHIIKTASKVLGVPCKFVPACVGEVAANAAKKLKAGEVLILENLRFHSEETAGDVSFAKELSKLGDVYVNDAFGTAHRAHASTAVVAQFFDEKALGYVMEAEIKSADTVLKSGQKPITAIMGGAKVSDKLLIIEKLMNVADNIIIGGGMSYTFSKADGGAIGNSIHEPDLLDYVTELQKKAVDKGVKIILPVDTVIADNFSNDAHTQMVHTGEIPDGWEGLDIGTKTEILFKEIIEQSKTLLWNGPMGVFEMLTFAKGTIAIANAVKSATEKGAFSLIGGGDSVAAINQLGFANDVSYVSTGGGALLEYMEGKELPGIKAFK